MEDSSGVRRNILAFQTTPPLPGGTSVCRVQMMVQTYSVSRMSIWLAVNSSDACAFSVKTASVRVALQISELPTGVSQSPPCSC